MSQILTDILVIIVFIVFNQIISLSAQPFHYSDPDLTNPNIPEYLRESCGYRYGVIPLIIRYKKSCFYKSFAKRDATLFSKNIYKDVVRPVSRIFGGKDVKYREAPWVVQITKRAPFPADILGDKYYYHHCTGVLITMRHILTAAHCGENFSKNSLRIYAGNDRTAQGWHTTDLTFHSHPNYAYVSPETGETIYNGDYDIAIIKLNKPLIDWNKEAKDENGMFLINTICLPLPENFSDPMLASNYYRKATIFGWGRVREHQTSTIIQRGDYSVSYTNELVNKFISFADGTQQRTCQGDSGSGLIQYLDEYEARAVLIGIHRAADNKKNITNPPCNIEHIGWSSALRVVHYLDWINEHLKQN